MAREMKDSGIEWIGEIPVTWETIRFKYLHNGMNTGEGIDKEYWTADENDTVFYTAGLEPIRTNYKEFPVWKYTKANDLLLARNGTPYVYLPSPSACYTEHIIRADVKDDVNRKFVRYCLQLGITSVVVDSVSLPTWSASLWNEQTITWPSVEEQSRIASFLDTECSRIDAVIEQTRASIEEYKKLKQAVITKVITKGIHPERQVKDSRHFFLGNISCDATVVRLKNIVEISDGTHDTPEYVDIGDETYPLVTSRCIVNGRIDESLANHISKKDYEQINLRSNVQKYDVIMPMIGTVGNPALVENDGDFAIKNVGLFRTNGNRTLGRYIVYVLDSDVVKIQFALEQRGGVQNFVSQEKLKNLYLPFHNNLEEIVDYLDTKCHYLDDVLAKKEQLILELETYKRSIIFRYITGKEDVPNADYSS